MRVLLVEDEVTLADAIARGLGAEGFQVDAVHNGLEGLERARTQGYAAIVLDIMLPGRNGYQICRDLRAEGVWTPILMLTAKDGEWDEAEALDTGADDFLSKPFSFVVLVARLRALLRRGAGPRPAVLEVGDLRLDPATRECHRGEVAVALTAREFALLEHLMRHRDEVVSQVPPCSRRCGARAPTTTPTWSRCSSATSGGRSTPPSVARSLVTVRGAGYRVVDDG